jgi:hypothetical protein
MIGYPESALLTFLIFTCFVVFLTVFKICVYYVKLKCRAYVIPLLLQYLKYTGLYIGVKLSSTAMGRSRHPYKSIKLAIEF